jgi:HlyD family secretion protein
MDLKSNQEPDVAQTLGIDRSSSRRKGIKRLLIVGLLIVMVGIAVWIWIGKDSSEKVHYKTKAVERGNLTILVTATGTLRPINTVEVGSELSGIIKTVDVDHNSRVKVGQVLARLDPSKLEAQVLQSRAALESAEGKRLQAQATLKEAQDKLDRFQKVRELSQNRVPSQSEFQSAEAALERAKADEFSARAAVSQARATLKAQETDLSKTVIRSPIHGIVLTRSVEPGQTVAATFQAPVLFTLAEDLTQMELIVDVDEADVGQVREGQGAVFRVDAYPDRTFNARITQTRYGSKTVQGVVTYETVLKVDNSDLSLRPGMTATADITVKKVENAVLIPQAALRFTPPPVQEKEKQPSRGLLFSLLPRPPKTSTKPLKDENSGKKQQTVWTLKDGQSSPLSITIGVTDGTRTEVTAGDVTPGMLLVVEQVKGSQ